MLVDLLNLDPLIVGLQYFADEILQALADFLHFRNIESIVPFFDGLQNFPVVIAIERGDRSDQNIQNDSE